MLPPRGLRERRRRSTCKKATLEPTWDETFRFVILDGPRKEAVDLEVEDWDMLSSNDFMGPRPRRTIRGARRGAASQATAA